MPPRKKIDWRDCAEQLGKRIPIDRLHPAVVEWARESSPRTSWVIGFSGGADSLALLLLLWAHWPQRRDRLAALHFNHRLRGKAADRDEAFCRGVCRDLDVLYRSDRWFDASRDPSEADARKARHAFFGREMRKLRSKAMWLGHQLDDVVETMFMRIARGSGTGGLAAPRPLQAMSDGRIHLRPLLSLKKSEIVEQLTFARIPWREDGSNSGGRYLRNRIRKDVVPGWLAAHGTRDALAGAALSRELLEEDDEALDAWLADLDPINTKGVLNLRRMAGRPRALVRRALHRWIALNSEGATISRQAFTALLNDVIQGRETRHSLGTDTFAKIGKTTLVRQPAPRKLSN